MPDQVRHDDFKTFYETIKIEMEKREIDEQKLLTGKQTHASTTLLHRYSF